MSESDWMTVLASDVLEFWFPKNGHEASFEAHGTFWRDRMRGGMDEAIRDRFSDLTDAAARGRLDHWAETARGRLALMIVLDQFSRTVWRERPEAFAQDIKAARLVLEALENGDYEALTCVWKKAFCLIALGHCEGPEHLERMDRIGMLARALVEAAPEHLRLHYRLVEDQNRIARDVIMAFGRHPHRNAVLGRISTSEEEAYIAAGDFPHKRNVPADREGLHALLSETNPPNHVRRAKPTTGVIARTNIGRTQMIAPEPPLRRATQADASQLADLVNIAGEGLPLHIWTGLAKDGEDPWVIGRARQADKVGKDVMIVVDHGAGAVASLTGYAIGPRPEPIGEDFPALLRPLQELENRALESWYINVLACYPHYRGQGLGSRLLDFAEVIADDQGLDTMSVIVADNNTGARRLYERHGYKEIARSPCETNGWQAETRDWVLLMKPL